MMELVLTEKGKESVRFEKFRSYVSSASSDDELNDVFGYVNRLDFFNHDETFIADYFKKLGIEYRQKEDIEVLNYFIKDKLGVEDNSVPQYLEDKLSKQILKEMLGIEIKTDEAILTEKIEQQFSDIEGLEKELENIFMGIYDKIDSINRDSKFVSVKKLDDLQLEGSKIYIKKIKDKIKFGYCAIICMDYKTGAYSWPTDVDTQKYSGFDVVITKKPKTVFRKKIKYDVKIRWAQKHGDGGGHKESMRWRNESKGSTINEFLIELKNSYLKKSAHRHSFSNYLKNMFKLPKIMAELELLSLEKKKTTVVDEVSNLFEEISQLREEK